MIWRIQQQTLNEGRFPSQAVVFRCVALTASAAYFRNSKSFTATSTRCLVFFMDGSCLGNLFNEELQCQRTTHVTTEKTI